MKKKYPPIFDEMMDRLWPEWRKGGRRWPQSKLIMLEQVFIEGLEHGLQTVESGKLKNGTIKN